MQITCDVDIKQVTAALGDAARRQIPFVAARTMTLLAGDVQKHLQTRLPKVFDAPTPFTLRGVYTKRAEKTNLTAEVYFPQSHDGAGKPLREYIRPGALGGLRHQKKTEYLLTVMGVLPAGWVTIPGKAMPLNQYGNLDGGHYLAVIRGLNLKSTKVKPRPMSATAQKRIKRMGVDNEYFAVTPGKNDLAKGGGWLPPGVYKRTGRKGENLVQYLKFVKKAAYTQRLDMRKEAQQAVKTNLNDRWREAVAEVVQRFPPK